MKRINLYIIILKFLIGLSSYYFISCEDNSKNLILAIHLIIISVLSILIFKEVIRITNENDHLKETIIELEKQLPEEVIEDTQTQEYLLELFIMNYWV